MNNKTQWDDLPELVTVNEVAQYLRVREQTVRNMIKRKDVKGIQVGKTKGCSWRIWKSEIEKLFK